MKKIGRQIVFIADENLYVTMIDTDMDVEILKQIDKIGALLASNRTTNSLLETLRLKRKIEPRQKGFWKQRVINDNMAHQHIIGEFSSNIKNAYETIEKEAKYILGVIKKIDEGISANDADVLANAKWIRLNTDYEPLIVTDDRDLVTSGHLISSFFGITLGVISLFEIIRRMELSGTIKNGPLKDYCEHYELKTPIRNLNHSWSKDELETEICDLLPKGKLSFHPCPSGRCKNPLRRLIRTRSSRKT